MPTNTAAWIESAKSNPLVVREAPYVSPKAGQIVVKNAAVAINPVDWKVQDYDFFVTKYPNILGEDVAGVVEEVGPSVTRFKKGDRVIMHAIGLMTGEASQGGFQAYTVGSEILTSPLPDSIGFEQGVVLPLAISTAAHGLYGQDYLGLASPSATPRPTGQWVFIWGGSSSVGATAVQLAAASGYQVVTTASARNHKFCVELGASQVFDYNSTDVVGEVVTFLKGKKLAGVYDAISSGGTVEKCCEIAQKSEGSSKVALVLPSEYTPKDVTVKSVFAPSIMNTEVGPAVWQHYLPDALAQGKLLPKPDPLVVGTGLDNVQKGMQQNKDGVSAKKVVVTI